MTAPDCTLTTVIHTVTTERTTVMLAGRLAVIVQELCEHRDDIERWPKGKVTVTWAGDSVRLRDWAGNDE